jgi:CPA2 family monovalent cation:H+ antiporter-2
MHHLPPLLVNITVALAYALAGGLIARRLGLPTIVGYLLAGVALGPLAPPGFRGDPDAIQQMAEFGVILLMFGVGIHYNFSDIWSSRRIVVPGAILQLAVIAAIGYGLASSWGFTPAGAWVFGIAIAVSSTVVLLRSLMDHGWLDSPAGKVAIGWLVVEDLLTVAILVLMPVLAQPSDAGPVWTAMLAVGKAAIFILLMLIAGARLVPAVLGRVAHTRSRELFILVALTMAVGTALASAYFFGVSLALGAFVAGVVVSESPFSHQISADLLPFREAFAVVFFVSIGMLVNPMYVLEHWDRLLAVTVVIVLAKGLASGAIAFVLGSSARTSLVLTAGRAQIGEFSFIVGQSGLALGVLDDNQYSLILAGAIVTITVNPFVMRLVEPAERLLRRRAPEWWQRLEGRTNDPAATGEGLANHVVIVGCGRVGRHIAETLKRLEIPRIVIESDPIRVDKLREIGVPVLYGEADNSEILANASLPTARALVITLPDDAANLAVAATARALAPSVQIISRASTFDGARQLRAQGVGEVVRPELEGGIEIVRRTLIELELPVQEVYRYADVIRHEGLDESERPSLVRSRAVDELLSAARDIEIGWVVVVETSRLAGKRLAESELRERAGVTVVGIIRQGTLISNPTKDEVFRPADRVAVIGTPPQVADAERLFAPAE